MAARDDDALLEHLWALELRLLDPAVRADPDQAGALLAGDFTEFGASGRTWDRTSVLAELRRDPGTAVEATRLQAVRLAPDLVLLTYRTPTALRTSLWRREGDGAWRIRHHQGTRTP